jgi:Tol biopolymer transport system component
LLVIAFQGLRRLSRPFVVLILVLVGAGGRARAQEPARPWLGWRTIETPNYRFHFPPELEDWTRDVASRVEAIDSAIASQVGYSPAEPTHVIVDDPYSVSNGYALPFIDRPVSVWWASPPAPRDVVGDMTSWGDMLASHELTHIAHMSRPSRNPFSRQFWQSMPVDIGPIMYQSPRWVYEGYATLVEGRITGVGRPHGVWRPAILRQWAIEGRLPSYPQLNDWSAFNGGEFAYLGGSAFLEWLAAQNGDSTLVHMWRRMTARRMRTFDEAFSGVYGDPPAIKYGQHVAELTRDAMAARAALESAPGGLVDGELVQRLTWNTGDPAISRDGTHVALVLRSPRNPGRLVVWNTAAEGEDSATTARRMAALKRDPMDVPDRRFYPPPNRTITSLPAWNGRSFQQPRWFRDNRRLLVTRWTVRGDGTLRPDLFVWDTERGDVRRVTWNAGLTSADPSPDGQRAIATQCHRGQCDVALVDLMRGRIRTLLAGSPARSYYRPRWSLDGARFVAAVSDSGRWRVLVANADGGNVRYVDPGDGANRYDAAWWPHGDSIVAVSERGGIPNIELLSVADASVHTLTRVTGAAVAPEVNPVDGSIWYLTLHSRGFDLRRLVRTSRATDSIVTVDATDFGFAGVQPSTPRVFPARPVAATQAYGAGPRFERWIPGFGFSGDGISGGVAVFSGDIVGRLNATATVALGQAGTARGGAIRVTWRYPRPTLEGGVFGFIHNPTQGPLHVTATDSIDASLLQSVLALSMERRWENVRFRARTGAGAGTFEPDRDTSSHFRGLAFGEIDARLQQLQGSMGVAEGLRVYAAHGHTGRPYHRVMGTATFSTLGADAFPLTLRGTLGWMHGEPLPFERFTVGGPDSPVADSSMIAQRYAMAIFPTGIAIGRALCAWRAEIPSGAWSWFYEGASAANDFSVCNTWNRAIGLDTRFKLAPWPPAFLPGLSMHAGMGYTLDAPLRHRLRAFVEMKVEP